LGNYERDDPYFQWNTCFALIIVSSLSPSIMVDASAAAAKARRLEVANVFFKGY
jgi:hypothetical protein